MPQFPCLQNRENKSTYLSLIGLGGGLEEVIRAFKCLQHNVSYSYSNFSREESKLFIRFSKGSITQQKLRSLFHKPPLEWNGGHPVSREVTSPSFLTLPEGSETFSVPYSWRELENKHSDEWH